MGKAGIRDETHFRRPVKVDREQWMWHANKKRISAIHRETTFLMWDCDVSLRVLKVEWERGKVPEFVLQDFDSYFVNVHASF